MIRIDLGMAVGLYCIAALIFFVLLWYLFVRRERKGPEWNITDHIERCSYCGHIFVHHARRRLMKCPVCQSYLETRYVDQEAQ